MILGALKKVLMVLAAACLVTSVVQGMTAYEALKVIHRRRGEALLGQVIEVRGKGGQPQPETWTILIRDSDARSGMREFVVGDGEIVSERVPVKVDSDFLQERTMDVKALNVDSDGVFRIANDRAVAKRVGFDRIDYLLRANSQTGYSEWQASLYNVAGVLVGRLVLSGVTGNLIEDLQILNSASSQPKVRRNPSRQNGSGEPIGGLIGDVRDTSKKVGTQIKKTTLTVLGNVEEVLTGRRTIDRSIRDQDEE